MLAGMIAKALDMSVGAADDMTAHGRCAAIAHPAGRLPLVVGQRASRREVVEVLPEDLLHGHGHARILAEMLQRLCGELQNGSTTVSRVALAIGVLEGELAPQIAHVGGPRKRNLLTKRPVDHDASSARRSVVRRACARATPCRRRAEAGPIALAHENP